jgi:hypothetical protein
MGTSFDIKIADKHALGFLIINTHSSVSDMLNTYFY